VLDGDTFRLDSGQIIRLRGVDTPESILEDEAGLLDRYAPWISERQNMRLGLGPDNNPRHLTGFDVPAAEAAGWFSGGIGRGVEQKVLGKLVPYLRAPAELALDRSFNFGNQISDYDVGSPLLTRVGLGYEEGRRKNQHRADPRLLHVIGATPFARWYTAQKKLTDDRKTNVDRALNLLTGLRVNTLDVRRAMSRERTRKERR